MLKTRVQTWDLMHRHPTGGSSQPLLSPTSKASIFARPSAFHMAREAYRNDGVLVFFRGLGVCSARAFVVNAVQWAVSFLFPSVPSREWYLTKQQVYEYMMKLATGHSNVHENTVA